MNEQIRQALARDRTIDIATIGCATGQSRHIEIWFHNPDGTVYITGTPGQPIGTRTWSRIRISPSISNGM